MPRTSSSRDNTTSAKPRARSTRSTEQPHTVTDRQAKRGDGAAGNGAAGNGASAAAASEMPHSPSYVEIADTSHLAPFTHADAVGGALVGMFWFNEPRDAFRLVSMALIIAGILGLKFTARA